jgi:hypothetical protein
MNRFRLVVAFAFATLFFCNQALGNSLRDINTGTLHTLEKQVLVDYRSLSMVGPEGKPLLSLDSKNSFAVKSPGGTSTYMLAITYAPKRSEFDSMESQCELPIYTAQNRLVSRIVSIGSAEDGVCEGFEAIGIVSEARDRSLVIGIIANMAYGPSAVERKVPFFIRWDAAARSPRPDKQLSGSMQRIKGLDSLDKMRKLLK